MRLAARSFSFAALLVLVGVDGASTRSRKIDIVVAKGLSRMSAPPCWFCRNCRDLLAEDLRPRGCGTAAARLLALFAFGPFGRPLLGASFAQGGDLGGRRSASGRPKLLFGLGPLRGKGPKVVFGLYHGRLGPLFLGREPSLRAAGRAMPRRRPRRAADRVLKSRRRVSGIHIFRSGADLSQEKRGEQHGRQGNPSAHAAGKRRRRTGISAVDPPYGGCL